MMKIFSVRLRELRIAAGMTQQQVADYLNIRQQSYARYETGAGEPNLQAVVQLAKLFGVSCDYLLGVTDY